MQQSAQERDEIARLTDEIEQLRTALEASDEENARLAEDRERLMRKITSQSRDLEAANIAYQRSADDDGEFARLSDENKAEELRVAFEELQVLTEELEIANDTLLETNRALDARVAERTRELAVKNAALADTERRFRTLVEGMPQLVWRSESDGRWVWASPQWESYTGLSRSRSEGMGWLAALHPDDRASARMAWTLEEGAETIEFGARVLDARHGQYRHFHLRAAAAQAESGDPVEWLGTATDVDALFRLQERQQLLVAELQHRVRNILTVVRSVFSRTVEADGPIEEMADHFKGRLDSLARTQVIVTQSATGLVDLQDLIRDELLSVGVIDGPGVEIVGPDVRLPPKAAESMGLAIHELTTNALKYGALRVSGGKLEIHWTINSSCSLGRRLDLTWTEQGVPAVPLQPTRFGFGSELIAEALPYRLGAETNLQFRGGGVCCFISIPLPDEGASAEPGKDQ